MISELLFKIGLLVFVTFTNVLIAMICGVTVIAFCLNSGWGRTETLAAAITFAVFVTAYIRFNHLIIQRFRNGEKK